MKNKIRIGRSEAAKRACRILLVVCMMSACLLACGVGTTKTVSSGLGKAESGLGTIRNLLVTAMQPVGKTTFNQDGGWNKDHSAASRAAVTIGTSGLKDGLCGEAYIGWSVYNVFNTTSGDDGYVLNSSTILRTFSEDGWGTYTDAEDVVDYCAGDLMLTGEQIWLVVGGCEDGSVVLLECSDPGVRLCGTRLEDGSDSEAVQLARQYMNTYYHKWYKKHPECIKDFSYLTDSDQMRWNRDTLSDEEKFTGMKADKILADLFGECE